MSHAANNPGWSARAGEWLLYAVLWVVQTATAPVSTTRLCALLAPFGGWLAWVLPGARARVLANIDRVWPQMDQAARRALVRDTGAAFMRLCVEYSRLDRVARETPVTTSGTLPPGGVILVSAHYGNWEAIRLAAKAQGRPCGIVTRDFNNRYLARYTRALIGRIGEPVLQKNRSGTRGLITHVARGGVVLILVDQRSSGAPFLPFLGHPAETVIGPAELALRTGAALVPAVARRNVAAARFEVTFESPVTGTDPGAMMTQVNARIGAWITADPAPWFWFHRRWKTTRASRPTPTPNPSPQGGGGQAAAGG